MDKNNRKLKILYKILYKCIKAMHMPAYAAHFPPTKILISSVTAQRKHTQTSAYRSDSGGLGKKKSGEWTKSRKR